MPGRNCVIESKKKIIKETNNSFSRQTYKKIFK